MNINCKKRKEQEKQSHSDISKSDSTSGTDASSAPALLQKKSKKKDYWVLDGQQVSVPRSLYQKHLKNSTLKSYCVFERDDDNDSQVIIRITNPKHRSQTTKDITQFLDSLNTESNS